MQNEGSFPSHPYAADFRRREWPLLCEACSLPRDPSEISALALHVTDTGSLFRLAEDHGVVAHLAAACSDAAGERFPPQFLEKLLQRRRFQSVLALAMMPELFRILDILQSAEIDVVIVKGPVLSLRAYGDPGMRRYGDVDLVVRHSDIARVMELLSKAAFQSRVPPEAVRSGKVPGEYVFRSAGTQLLFEFHTEKTLRYFPRRLPIDDYFARKTTVLLDGKHVPALALEDEFILICVHGAKHFWERLLLIADVAAISNRREDFDWHRMMAGAQAVGASRIVRLALLLARRVLHVPIPAPLQAEIATDRSCQSIAARIDSWLPYAGHTTPAFPDRALFRFQMRGGWLAGAGYLARLSLSTTEEDWAGSTSSSKSRVGEILRRPFRLARKYRRGVD
jgi:hypothetical protein